MTAGLDFDGCVSQLKELGLKQGDAVLVRTALIALGQLNDPRNRADFLIDALLQVIGPEGLLLGLSFSKNDWIFRFPKLPAYDKAEKANTGGFVAAMMTRENARRSEHPTNSFVAIGRDADQFLAGHNQTAACFAPMADLIERKGKMLLIGCEFSSPGFSTVHLAQHRLGLDTRTWMGLILGRRYKAADGRTHWYRKRDVPGCSMGFDNFYGPYRDKGALAEHKIGDANAMLIDARTAYDIEYSLVAQDPTIALCDRDSCMSCRLGWFYKPMEIRRYLAAKLHR